ncbi:hypothetical protein Trydic_g835 [Trypoxylus dichotomus]
MKEDTKTSEIQHLQGVFDESAESKITVYWWIDRFKYGGTPLEDDIRSAVENPLKENSSENDLESCASSHRKKTENVLNNLRRELLPHPPYSADLAPIDYHLFPDLKKTLRGIQFAIHRWIDETPEKFLEDGLKQ